MTQTMIEEHPKTANSPLIAPEVAQVHDLVAMLECQAYALEDIMKQKKNLAAQVRQSTSQKKLPGHPPRSGSQGV